MRTKRQKSRIHNIHDVPDMVKLEINKLGRPYHKVPKIFTDRFDILDAKFGNYFLKKYRVNVTLRSLSFEMDCAHKHALIFSTQVGNVGFDIDRLLLLHILNDYYGLNSDSAQTSPELTTTVTKTEERLKNKLGSELTELVLHSDIFNFPLEIKNDYSSVINQWSYKLTFALEGYNEGVLHVLLDNHHVDKLLAALRSPGEELNKDEALSAKTLEFLVDHIPIRLNGRLSHSQLTVSELLELGVGDVLPVSLPDRFPIFIGKEQPFNAVISEDRGKLYFSEFNDKVNEINND